MELLTLPKTAFLASGTIPPDVVLRCYDWATWTASSPTSARWWTHSKLRHLLNGHLSNNTNNEN